MQLPEMPLTPNGKVNTKALPMPSVQTDELVAPVTQTEKTLFKLAAEILKHYINQDLEAFLGCREDIVAQLFPSHAAFCQDLELWYGLFTGLSVAKRIQAPPVLSISRRAFGTDYREAQMSTYYSLEYKELKEKLLVQERLF